MQKGFCTVKQVERTHLKGVMNDGEMKEAHRVKHRNVTADLRKCLIPLLH